MNRNYLVLWSLLAVAFVAVIVLSAFSPVEIFGYELKDSGIAKAFNAPKGDTITAPDTIAEQSELGNVIEIDTASQTILFIGDSMLDGLYPRLAAYADENGHELYAVIWYSSTSEIWGKSERLKEYIAQVNPTFIFLSIGANELFVKDIAEKRKGYVEKIINDIGDIPYLWIGPPNWKPDTGINRLVASVAGKGNFFLSDGMHFDRKKDGAHPTDASSDLWMDSIVRWMPLHNPHPIKLDVPQSQHARAKRVFVHQPSK